MKTQRDTAGDTILHQQYLLLLLVELVVTAVDAVTTKPPSCEPQNATPCTDTPPQVADQFDWPIAPEESEHVVDEFNFTHFVTAAAGGIVAAQIRPTINKYFFIFKPLFIFLNEKTTRKFGWSGGWEQLQELCRLFYIRDPPDRNQEFIYRRNKNSATAPFQHSDACTGFSHPTDETLASNIMIPCQVT